jgi:hypothetical protein
MVASHINRLSWRPTRIWLRYARLLLWLVEEGWLQLTLSFLPKLFEVHWANHWLAGLLLDCPACISGDISSYLAITLQCVESLAVMFLVQRYGGCFG